MASSTKSHHATALCLLTIYTYVHSPCVYHTGYTTYQPFSQIYLQIALYVYVADGRASYLSCTSILELISPFPIYIFIFALSEAYFFSLHSTQSFNYVFSIVRCCKRRLIVYNVVYTQTILSDVYQFCITAQESLEENLYFFTLKIFNQMCFLSKNICMFNS